MSLMDVAAGPNFYDAYDSARRKNSAEGLANIQGAGQIQGILASLQKQQQEQAVRARQEAFRQQVGALGPNLSNDQMVQLAVRSGLMEPKDIGAMAQGAENKRLQVDATTQQNLARIAQAAATSQRTFESRARTQAETEAHNAEMEDRQREANRIAGQRVDLGISTVAFNQRNAAARTQFDTGAVVAPTINAPGALAAPPAQAPGALSQLMAGGQPIPANERGAAEAVMQASAAGQPLTLPGSPQGALSALLPQQESPVPAAVPAPPNNMDARDLRLQNMRQPTAPVAASAVPAAGAPAQAPVMPTFSGSPREVAHAQNQWRMAQEKAGMKLNLAGGRESVMINRVITGANQVEAALSNIVKLPLTVDRGYFGGRGQKEGILNAGKETLAQSMTTQDVQSYNILTTGIQRGLAAIESSGLAPPNSLMHQMDAVVWKAGWSNFSKLQALAETRQIVERGMEVVLANHRADEKTKALVQKIIDGVQKSVPFTNSDLIELQQAQQIDPKITLADAIRLNKEKASPAAGGWSIRPK